VTAPKPASFLQRKPDVTLGNFTTTASYRERNKPAMLDSCEFLFKSAIDWGGLGRTALRSAIPGAVAGAASGYASSDDGEGLTGALRGGAMGGLAGGVAGTAGSVAGRAIGQRVLGGKNINAEGMLTDNKGNVAVRNYGNTGNQRFIEGPEARRFANSMGDLRGAKDIGGAAGDAGALIGGAAGGYAGRGKKKQTESKEEKKEASMSMTAQEKVLFDNVYLPAFAEKCAALGVDLPDGESVKAALDIAALVKSHSQKSASSTVKSAAAELRGAMGVASSEHDEHTAWFDKRASMAGAELSQVPEIRQALAELVG
jgi:hypothetical protein